MKTTSLRDTNTEIKIRDLPPGHLASTDGSTWIDGEDWAGLAREAGKSYDRANRDDVLSILSDNSLSGGQKKAAIRALDGNATWQYLITNQMAILRSVIVSVE